MSTILSCKKSEMVTLQKSEKRKDHSNRVKIILKTSENYSKASENHSEESENHSKRVTFTFLGSSLRDSVGVVLTLFTLLKSNHFTLFTLREYTHFLISSTSLVLQNSKVLLLP